MAINFHQIKSFVKHFFTATRKGHNIHSPLVYQLCEEVFYNKAEFYDFEKLKNIRKELLADSTIITVEDFGAGSKTFRGNERRICDIAASGISSRHQSEVLYRLASFLRPHHIVELGTSLGLNALYLASANSTSTVISIEGSASLNAFATRLAQKAAVRNITFINGKFDEQLPGVLNSLASLDLFYVDGNHTFEATVRYFKMALDNKNKDSVFVFDDIYWSDGMTKAWEEIKKDPSVTLSIDAFYFGIVFFKPEIKEKVEVKIRILRSSVIRRFRGLK